MSATVSAGRTSSGKVTGSRGGTGAGVGDPGSESGSPGSSTRKALAVR